MATFFNTLSLLIFILVGLCGLYLWMLALIGIRQTRTKPTEGGMHRFAIAIPAHNEEDVIGATVSNLMRLNYPRDLFTVFVVADYCSDRTAVMAREAGAICYERQKGERSGKGAAMLYLFEQIFLGGGMYDAVVVFDADTQVDPQFLQLMNARLNRGDRVIQGKHVISNPRAAWFPALTWAMMTVDNRYTNQSRANLGLSARHMGDSICLRSEVLQKFGWGAGLTEDYEFRLRLLLEGIRIGYEPNAIGYGQAPLTWKEALAQRLRWAKGRSDANKRFRGKLLRTGLQKRDAAMLDAALMSVLPSYSNLTLAALFFLILHLLSLAIFGPAASWAGLIWAWGGLALSLFIYPLFGLALERAPGWAYLAILSGPVFIAWRTYLNLRLRFSKNPIPWIRTPHKAPPHRARGAR